MYFGIDPDKIECNNNRNYGNDDRDRVYFSHILKVDLPLFHKICRHRFNRKSKKILDLGGEDDHCNSAGKTNNERVRYKFQQIPQTDRKSTRLNSSHVAISYAVFCLKKK